MPKAKKKAPVKKKQMKAKKTVAKQNQHRVEYKDRISTISTVDLTSNLGDYSTGPANSVILLPRSYTNTFQQGVSNGQIEGNSITPKYLSMKVRLDFSRLPQYVKHNASNERWDYQQYDLYVQQVWIKETLNEERRGTFANQFSNRLQPAFENQTTYDNAWTNISKKMLFNGRIQPDFLSYEKKADTQIRTLRKWRVLGDQNAGFTSANINSTLGTDPGPDASVGRVSPDKHYTFKWEMPKDKQFLSPVIQTTTTADYGFSSMWIPAVVITMNRKYGDAEGVVPATADSPLLISEISHFTYTDS
jgi:hypothetical protein